MDGVCYMSVWITDIVVSFTDACDSVICSHGDADRSPDVWAAYGKLCYNMHYLYCC